MEPVSTMTLLKMAGLNAGMKGLAGFLGKRDKKRNRRKEKQGAELDRLIASLSQQLPVGYGSVRPQEDSTASQIAGQFNQNVADPLLQQIIPDLLRRGAEGFNLGGLGSFFGGLSLPSIGSTYLDPGIDWKNIWR